MSSDVLLEEFEVLESIYPDEFTKLSERNVRVIVEPDDLEDGEDTLRLTLTVTYTDEYPDALPELELDAIEGELDEEEESGLLTDIRTIGEENLGMAMTFTMVSHLREQLSGLIRQRAERTRKEEAEVERKALEAEEARTRGTPVTVNSFLEWKAKFDKELAQRKAREDDDRLKGLSPKEREEYKRIGTRLTGRQLFERDKNLDISDDALLEEGTVSVDISQYERNRDSDDEDEAERVHFSDSD
ncbi:RWD-domain-containing protein [Auriscalpium vulgare]|uniref:RWD-domain-containing protein n=1 Tax=Auriscalpium vulgare TaxID=40419 RepID=A0ACB8SCV2_9AGAM|nr:RWD-domain-containing protein [Auriscalpium vulgare]